MQITETHSKGLKREYDVTIPSADIEKQLTQRLEDIGKRAKISGFRPGKIPLPLLKQRYNGEALSHVLEACIDKGIKQTVKDHDLKLALKPNVNVKSYEENKDFTFHIDVEILPTIGDIKLDGLSFVKHVVKVPSKAVTDVLSNLAKRNNPTIPLKTSRKSKKGDIAIIDFVGFIGNEPIKGGAGQDYPLELGSGSFIPGFEDQLVDQEKGATVEVNVTFPKDYQEKKYADKAARFDVTIKDIHETGPEAVDEDLAKKLGFKSLDAMKEQIEKNISNDYETQSFLNTKRHVLDALAEKFTFEVPQSMVDLEFDNIWSQLLNEIGAPQKQAANTNEKEKVDPKLFEKATGKTEEELRKSYKTIAERRVRLGILLAEIGNRHKITVSNQELMGALTARAREFPGQEKEVFDFYRTNESALSTLRAPIFENKVVEFILDKSDIKEKSVSPEELEKILAREEEEAEKKISQEAHKTKKPETTVEKKKSKQSEL